MQTFDRVRKSLQRALLYAIPMAIGVVILNFLLLQLLPGDAVDMLVAESGSATIEGIQQLRTHYGLDLTTLQRLWAYLTHLVHFDLGFSPRNNESVNALIFSRLGNTLLLMLTALSFSLLLGILCGVLMAVHVGKVIDRILSVIALLLYSTPSFWLGLMAIIFFSVKLGWLPTDGNMTINADYHGWVYIKDRLSHLILPAITMSGFFIAIFSRLTRASMLEISQQDFVRTARAKGLSPLSVTLKHILRNALIPVTTVAGMHLGTLLGGSVVIEVVFSWPGLGRLAMDSVMARDYNVLLGILFLSSLLVILANVLVDVLHGWLDPRIQAQ